MSQDTPSAAPIKRPSGMSRWLLRSINPFMKARMQEITNPADYKRVWTTVVATMKGYDNYTKKTSRKIPLGWLRPV